MVFVLKDKRKIRDDLIPVSLKINVDVYNVSTFAFFGGNGNA